MIKKIYKNTDFIKDRLDVIDKHIIIEEDVNAIIHLKILKTSIEYYDENTYMVDNEIIIDTYFKGEENINEILKFKGINLKDYKLISNTFIPDHIIEGEINEK